MCVTSNKTNIQIIFEVWGEVIRIYECKGGIIKSVLRITVWYHEASTVMKNGDHKEQIFLSHQHTNNRFFFLLTIKYCIFV